MAQPPSTEATPLDLRDHYIVSGLSGLGLRIVENLHDLGAIVVVIAGDAAEQSARDAVEALGVQIVDGRHDDEQSLISAGIDHAQALALVADDDTGNLRGALAAARHSITPRIVIRLLNEDLGEHIKKLFDDCIVLSPSAIAAPFFAAASLGEHDGDRLSLAGHSLLVHRSSAELPEKPQHVLALANVRDGARRLFPDDADPGGQVLVDLGPFDEPPDSRRPVIGRRHRTLSDRWWAGTATIRQILDRRFRVMMLVLIALLAAATVFFSITKSITPLESLYFAVVTLSTVGYGDVNLETDKAYVQVFGILFILAGAAAIAVFFSLLTDTIVGVRLAEIMGGLRGRMRHHVIVCGLGDMGSKVALTLATELGATVVAIEKDESNPNVAALRRLGIPIVIGDATHSETLRAAQIDNAECVVAITDDDVVDLEIAVNARNQHPQLRIVLRLFDHEISTALERRFDIHISRSSEAIAAPVFAEAMLRQAVVATIDVAGAALVFAEIDAPDHDGIVGRSVGDLERGGELRILAITDADSDPQWWPKADRTVAAGERVAVVGRTNAVDAIRS